MALRGHARCCLEALLLGIMEGAMVWCCPHAAVLPRKQAIIIK